jgi:hypothetical protein
MALAPTRASAGRDVGMNGWCASRMLGGRVGDDRVEGRNAASLPSDVRGVRHPQRARFFLPIAREARKPHQPILPSRAHSRYSKREPHLGITTIPAAHGVRDSVRDGTATVTTRRGSTCSKARRQNCALYLDLGRLECSGVCVQTETRCTRTRTTTIAELIADLRLHYRRRESPLRHHLPDLQPLEETQRRRDNDGDGRLRSPTARPKLRTWGQRGVLQMCTDCPVRSPHPHWIGFITDSHYRCRESPLDTSSSRPPVVRVERPHHSSGTGSARFDRGGPSCALEGVACASDVHRLPSTHPIPSLDWICR